jgi:hypothetical protein
MADSSNLNFFIFGASFVSARWMRSNGVATQWHLAGSPFSHALLCFCCSGGNVDLSLTSKSSRFATCGFCCIIAPRVTLCCGLALLSLRACSSSHLAASRVSLCLSALSPLNSARQRPVALYASHADVDVVKFLSTVRRCHFAASPAAFAAFSVFGARCAAFLCASPFYDFCGLGRCDAAFGFSALPHLVLSHCPSSAC